MSAGVEAGKVAGVLEGRDAVIPKAKKALKKTKKQSKKVKKVSKHGKKTAKGKKMKKTGKAAQRAGAKPKGKPTKGSEVVVINLNLNSFISGFFVWYHVLAQVVKEKRSEADARHEPGTAAQEAHVAEPGSTAALQASVQPSAQVRNGAKEAAVAALPGCAAHAQQSESGSHGTKHVSSVSEPGNTAAPGTSGAPQASVPYEQSSNVAKQASDTGAPLAPVQHEPSNTGAPQAPVPQQEPDCGAKQESVSEPSNTGAPQAPVPQPEPDSGAKQAFVSEPSNTGAPQTESEGGAKQAFVSEPCNTGAPQAPAPQPEPNSSGAKQALAPVPQPEPEGSGALVAPVPQSEQGSTAATQASVSERDKASLLPQSGDGLVPTPTRSEAPKSGLVHLLLNRSETADQLGGSPDTPSTPAALAGGDAGDQDAAAKRKRDLERHARKMRFYRSLTSRGLRSTDHVSSASIEARIRQRRSVLWQRERANQERYRS